MGDPEHPRICSSSGLSPIARTRTHFLSIVDIHPAFPLPPQANQSGPKRYAPGRDTLPRCHWPLSSAIHLSKTDWSCGSILVKKIPIPAFGRTPATLPRASRLSLLWEIFILTFVPGSKGFSVSTWHPKRLRSLVCSLV